MTSAGDEDAGYFESPVVERAVHGDQASVESLCADHHLRVQRTVKRLLGPDPEVEHVVEETFLTISRRLSRFRGRSRLATWIHRIALAAALVHLRARQLGPERLAQVAELDGGPPPGAGDSMAAIHRRARGVLAALDLLPASQRSLLLLGPVQGRSCREVARALHTRIDLIRGRMHRARVALRRACAR